MDRKLRLIVTERDGVGLEAQLLELDIVVCAQNEKGLLEELGHQIELEYRLAKHHERVPFVHLLNVSPEYSWAWKDEASKSMGRLVLPADVLEALALVLRANNTDISVTEFKVAA